MSLEVLAQAAAAYARDDLTAAEALCRTVLERDPAEPDGLNLLGAVATARGKHEIAARLFRLAIALRPKEPTYAANLGGALLAQGARSAARVLLRWSLTLDDSVAENHGVAGELARAEEDHDAALICCRHLLALTPAHAQGLRHLAATLLSQGHVDRCLPWRRRVVALLPTSRAAAEDLLFTHCYADAVPPGEERHAIIAAARLLPVRPRLSVPPLGGRPLRIGYVSPDFREHSCAWFLEPLLAQHDRQVVEIFAYAELLREDAVTQRFKALADHWRPTHDRDDDAVAALIAADQIDILIDCAGLMRGGRPGVFARRPAPVQAIWLGYDASPANPGIDWRIGDPVATPTDDPEPTLEAVWRLDRVSHAWRPPVEAPEVAPAPALSLGRVTFGSFNNASKLSPATLALWARILAAVPDSRLHLKARQGHDGGTKRRLETALARHGVAPERLTFSPWLPETRAHLAHYATVDIALDPLPYNGVTTSCEALWMGVPLIAWRGRRMTARIGASLLDAIGLGDLIAEDHDAYLARAVALARDIDRLNALRVGLRPRVAASPLRDEAGFARALEAAYRAMISRRG